MKKIPTLFIRDPEDRKYVTEELTPGLEWVLEGNARPTRKWDGTCTQLDADGNWWARREVKPGKPQPENYIVEDFDELTGKTQGWEPIEQSSFAKFHAEAVQDYIFRPGTYELVGPKINGNPEGLKRHNLISHDGAIIDGSLYRKLDPQSLLFIFRNLMESTGWEGIVWHNPDGRMAKLKQRDLRP